MRGTCPGTAGLQSLRYFSLGYAIPILCTFVISLLHVSTRLLLARQTARKACEYK